MPGRLVFSAAAIGVALIVPGQAAAQGSSPTQVRPAQVMESRCDDLLRRVERGLLTAKAARVPDAQDSLHEAEELCHSGQAQEGMAILRQTLLSMHEGPE